MPKISPVQTCEVIIVGAGISGISSALALRQQGFDDVLMLESADGPGGVWRENRYPGVACDIPAILYQFKDEKKSDWSKLYAGGREILQYLKRLYGDRGLEAKTRFGQAVANAAYDEVEQMWAVTTKAGEVFRCRYLIKATGAFNAPKIPNITGLSSFTGELFHTARWPEDLDLRGKRVAVVGTGASAIQLVPIVAKSVAQLTVYQRTPIWLLPKPDLNMSAPVRWAFKHVPGAQELTRIAAYHGLGHMLRVLLVSSSKHPRTHRLLEKAGLWNIRHQVKDPALREKFTPDYNLGCKRPSFSNEYYKTFEQPHVHLNTDGITKLTSTGIRSKGAQEAEPFDVIIMATGFNILGDSAEGLPAFPIIGKNGLDLHDYWHHQAGFKAYRGAAVAGFPNLFLNLGIPYAGGTSWYETADMISAQIVQCLQTAQDRHCQEIEVKPEVVDQYMQHMDELLQWSIHRTGSCATSNSYYYDAKGDTPLYTAEPPGDTWDQAVASVAQSYEFRRSESVDDLAKAS